MEFSGLLDVDGLFKWNDIFTPAVQQPWQIKQVSNYCDPVAIEA